MFKESEYVKSGKLVENLTEARKKGVEALKKKMHEKIANYDLNPSRCKKCSCALEYAVRKNKFCSRSCSAAFNNVGRVDSLSTKKKKSDKNKIYYENNSNRVRQTQKVCKIFKTVCVSCGKVELVRHKRQYKKTCGNNECIIDAIMKGRTYQNGKQSRTKFFNMFENKEVILESSWEVEIAQLLTDKKIRWTRPKSIKWVDKNQKERRYYPDFYLTDFDVFLDPKNPYAMEKDQEKLEIVCKQISLIFGDISIVRDYVNQLN